MECTMKFFPTGTRDSQASRTHCFYIPVVEQIKEGAPDWGLVRQEPRIRKFYSSPESLQQAESSRLAAGRQLACYKVMLSDSEKEQLTTNVQGTAYTAFLSFKPEDILSLILFKPGNQLELANPSYYQEEEMVLGCGG